MPTYEYACKACGEHLEVVQSFTDDALTKCPSCKKKQLRKVFGSIGITFKGSGFYKTDSRNGSSSSTTSTEGSPSTEVAASSSDSSSSGDSSSSKDTTPASSSKDSSSKGVTPKDGKKDTKKAAARSGPSAA